MITAGLNSEPNLLDSSVRRAVVETTTPQSLIMSETTKDEFLTNSAKHKRSNMLSPSYGMAKSTNVSAAVETISKKITTIAESMARRVSSV